MKKYILMFDEVNLMKMRALLNIEFEYVELQGMDVTDNPSVKILVTPVQPAEVEVVIDPQEPASAPVADAEPAAQE